METATETATFRDATTKTPHGSGADAHATPETGSARPRDERTAALIVAAQGGDRGALDALLAEARPRALAVALKVLRNADDAEDAVQDAFLKVWRYLDRFEGRSSFSTWIHRIVMNTSLDLLRRQSCRPDQGVEEETEERRRAPEPTHDRTPERTLAEAQTGLVVHAALAALTPTHRMAITLREFEDHSYEEIARVSACPVGTVMSRLHHARRKLADELRAVLEPADAVALCAA